MSDEKKELTDEEMEKTAGGYDGRVFGCDYINSEGQQCCCTFSNMWCSVKITDSDFTKLSA